MTRHLELLLPCCKPGWQHPGDKLEENFTERVIWINSKFLADTFFIFNDPKFVFCLYWPVREKKMSPLECFAF
jgi:hypothetical protein